MAEALKTEKNTEVRPSGLINLFAGQYNALCPRIVGLSILLFYQQWLRKMEEYLSSKIILKVLHFAEDF